MSVVQNAHSVPAKQWRKWSDQARRVFNLMYVTMKDSPWICQSPTLERLHKDGLLSDKGWNVTAWNAAWLAADAADEARKCSILRSCEKPPLIVKPAVVAGEYIMCKES